MKDNLAEWLRRVTRNHLGFPAQVQILQLSYFLHAIILICLIPSSNVSSGSNEYRFILFLEEHGNLISRGTLHEASESAGKEPMSASHQIVLSLFPCRYILVFNDSFINLS